MCQNLGFWGQYLFIAENRPFFNYPWSLPQECFFLPISQLKSKIQQTQKANLGAHFWGGGIVCKASGPEFPGAVKVSDVNGSIAYTAQGRESQGNFLEGRHVMCFQSPPMLSPHCRLWQKFEAPPPPNYSVGPIFALVDKAEGIVQMGG